MTHCSYNLLFGGRCLAFSNILAVVIDDLQDFKMNSSSLWLWVCISKNNRLISAGIVSVVSHP